MVECFAYDSLIIEHDVLIVEYEARVKALAKLAVSERLSGFADCESLSRHATKTLRSAQAHRKIHHCGPQVSSTPD